MNGRKNERGGRSAANDANDSNDAIVAGFWESLPDVLPVLQLDVRLEGELLAMVRGWCEVLVPVPWVSAFTTAKLLQTRT